MGMTEEGIKQLFHPFAKLEDPEHLNAQGCGLGLNICNGLVKALGGAEMQVGRQRWDCVRVFDPCDDPLRRTA